MDESRIGLQTIRRRRITARRTTPVGSFQQRFENFYLYGAVAPHSGDGFFLGLPQLNADQFQVFLDAFAAARSDTLNVLVVDTSRCHTATDLVVPPNVVRLFPPPAAPELNPAARVWEARTDALAWACCADLAALQARVVAIVQSWEAELLRSLTAYPFIMDAINALSP